MQVGGSAQGVHRGCTGYDEACIPHVILFYSPNADSLVELHQQPTLGEGEGGFPMALSPLPFTVGRGRGDPLSVPTLLRQV